MLQESNQQTIPPDHFYDFSKYQSINKIDYVFDQVTKNDLYSFGFYPDRPNYCANGASTQPERGPDGLHFSRYTDSIRMENANNLGLGSKFMIAAWLKLHPQPSSPPMPPSFFAIRRYDTNNGYNPILSLNLKHGFPNNEMQFEIGYTLYHYQTQAVQRSWAVIKKDSVQKDGWYLFSVMVDSSSLVGTTITSRISSLSNGKDTSVIKIDYYVYGESVFTSVSPKCDVYIGGFCYPQDKEYKYSGFFTMGKLYIWKKLGTDTWSDTSMDRFFYRNNAQKPLCEYTHTSCAICTVSYPFNSNYEQILQCPTNDDAKSQVIFAEWLFDTATDLGKSQYIEDTSGNSRHLLKAPANAVEDNEVFRIMGQGYMFYDGAKVQTVQPIPFRTLTGFTVEFWIRRVNDAKNTGSQPTVVPFHVQIDGGQSYLKMELSDESKQCIFKYRKEQDNTYQNCPNLLQKTDQWQFIAMTVNIQNRNKDQYNIAIRFQVDDQTTVDYKGTYNDNPIEHDLDALFYIYAKKTVIFKQYKVYSYARYLDEFQPEFKKHSALNPCIKLGNQGQCDFCPNQTSTCISTCDQNKFGNDCTACHFSCGHCTAATKADCLYCTRDTTQNIIYSNTYGNCTCKPGFYYNAVTDKCEACDTNCVECFGKDKTQCLTCKTTSSYFPDQTCVTDCNDPVITQGVTTVAYYKKEETLSNGSKYNLCTKCHPYCSECSGSFSSNCTKCQPGYFLKGTSTCYDSCPDGTFPDLISTQCKTCDLACKTCTAGANNNCLTCTDPAKVQQDGKCQAKCNDGYFADASKVCGTCNAACATCTTRLASDCQSCNTNYYLEWLGTTCKSTCKDSTYADTNTNQCLMCHYSCETCSGGGGPDKCTKCAAGFLKRGSFCVTACADSEYEINGTCVTCDSKCSTCYGTRNDQCYTCAENSITGIGYFYFNDSCLEKCPDGYYQDNLRRICKKCNPRCATCISDTFCTSCIYGPYQLNNGECTFFTCLDTQYRAIKPQLACYECDSSCLTCQGESKFDCLTCKPQNQFQAQQCMSCSQQPGMTDPLDETPGCVEICGDGFNYGFFQCDDGNVINGDGCSSKCTIESGFNCTTGSKLAPSVCMDNKNPTPKISLVSSKNFIYIEFDEEVQLQKALDETNVKITITGPQSSYKFDWRLADDYKTSEPVQMAVIELSMYSSLKGDSKEQVIIQFLTDQIYKDPTGNGIITVPLYSYLNKYEYIDPETKAKLDAAGDTSMLATFGAVAINLVISQLFGGSIAAMWTMVNTIQLISLLPLCNVNFPKITVMVLEKMLTSHGESTIIPNVFYTFLINRSGSAVKVEPALNERFSDYGWTVSNFLYLSGRKILLWTLIIFAYPFVWYMKRKYADKHKLCQMWVKAEQKFRYTLLLRGVIMSYVSMYLAFILGIFQMDLTTMENTISAFSAIAFGIILTYLPVLLMNILQRNYEKIQTDKFMISYSTIVKEVDLSHPIRYMYYPVFLMRRALFAISLVLFANNPVQQIGFMSATAFVMIIYVCVIKPQKEKVMIILTAFGEGVLLFLHLYSILFLDEDLPEEKSNSYGWFMICIIGLYILTNWVVIIVITVKQLKQKWADYKKSKVDVKKKAEEDKEYKKWKKKRHIRRQMEQEQEKQQMLEILDDETRKNQRSNGDVQVTIPNFMQGPQHYSPSPFSPTPYSPYSPYTPNNGMLDPDGTIAMFPPMNDMNGTGYNHIPSLSDINGNANAGGDPILDEPPSPNIFASNNKFLHDQISEQQKQASFNMNRSGSGQSERYQSSFTQIGPGGGFPPNSSLRSPGIKPKIVDRYANDDNQILLTDNFSGQGINNRPQSNGTNNPLDN
eukprot:403356244